MSEIWQSPAAPEPPESDRATRVVLLTLLGGVALIVAGVLALLVWGLQLVTDNVREQIEDHSAVVEHIGTVESFEIAWIESGELDDADTFVYEVKGPKGRGRVIARHLTTDDGDEDIVWAKLKLPSGEELDLIGEE